MQVFLIMGKLTKKLSERERKNGFCERLQGEPLCGVNNFPYTLHRVNKNIFFAVVQTIFYTCKLIMRNPWVEVNKNVEK